MGDVIVKLGETEVKQMKDLLLALSKFEVGTMIKSDLLQDGFEKGNRPPTVPKFRCRRRAFREGIRVLP